MLKTKARLRHLVQRCPFGNRSGKLLQFRAWPIGGCSKSSCMQYRPMPRWVLMLAYRAVPVRFLFSRYGMCWCVLESRYFFASPKSITYTRFPFFPRPIRKLSGFISRWIKFFECMYSIRLICIKTTTVFLVLTLLPLPPPPPPSRDIISLSLCLNDLFFQ